MSDRESAGDRLTAVSRASIETGAVISYSGDTLVADGESIVAAVASRLTGPAASVHGDEWLTDAVPVLARGDAWIVPLAWVPDHLGRDDPRDPALRDRIGDLWRAVWSACEHRHGNGIAIDLDGATPALPYAAELLRTGARRADWWEFAAWAVVLVVYGDPIPAPVRLMAVQVVPVGWVSEARRTAPKRMPHLDLAWSWADVVAFAESDDAGAAASLGKR